MPKMRQSHQRAEEGEEKAVLRKSAEECSSMADRFRPLKSNKQMTKIVKSIHKNYAES